MNETYQNNKVSIHVDSNGRRQLQLDIDTHISEEKRGWVLMAATLRDLVELEQRIAKASHHEIEEWHEQYKRMEAEDNEEEAPLKSPILGPNGEKP